jgi:hypothetical protein
MNEIFWPEDNFVSEGDTRFDMYHPWLIEDLPGRSVSYCQHLDQPKPRRGKPWID